MLIGFLGGTGDQGRGLARRFAIAGHDAVLGSRDAQRASTAAAELSQTLPDGSGNVSGATNSAVAADAEVVVVAVPYDGHEALLKSLIEPLTGKIVIDCVNPLGFDKQGAYPLEVPAGSAAAEAVQTLPDSRVVAAFHHVSAVLLLDESIEALDTDILVLSDDREAAFAVQSLAAEIKGMRGVYAGKIRNARQIEALTANLISINRAYKAHTGLRITDI